MKIIGVIPARYQSSRFPGKVLAVLKGKPLIEHVYRQAQKAKVLDEIIVATDDERVLKAVRAFGGSARMVVGKFSSGSDRAAYLAREIEADIFINIQADEPFIAPEVIIEVAEPFQTPGVLMTTAATPVLSETEWVDTNAVKVVVDRFGDALYFTRASIPYERDNQGRLPKTAAYKHLGIYGFRRDFLLKFASWPTGVLEEIEQLEQLRAQENGAKIRVVITPFDSQCVDTPEDLARLNASF
ncbi:MAG: 3-deoxy-manno-octulosonate cytidylyltransferase [Candidatus Ratteibacteria bacterium]|jgi:3-deoxy-manno-octulosonate cytidylyltransferase (CMP-KDO synthetase)